MKISNNVIKDIAGNLDCGLVCFINTKTYEVKFIADPDGIYFEEELWKEDINEIENIWEGYIKVEKMSSREAFRIMEFFTDQLSNEDIRNRLIYALNRNQPFKNFKYEVDYNEDVRQEWFKFKALKYEEWVKERLDYLMDSEE